MLDLDHEGRLTSCPLVLRCNLAMLRRGQDRNSADVEVLHFFALVIISLD